MVLTVEVVGALSAERLCTILAAADWDVADLKWQIERDHGVPDIEQRLMFGERVLSNTEKLSDIASVASEPVLFVHLFRADPVWARLLCEVRSGQLRLQDVDPKFQADRDIVFAAVHCQNGALAFAGGFQHDREVAMAAVCCHGQSLQYCSKELRNCRELILAAVEKDGLAIRHAPVWAQGDEGIARAAIGQNGWAFELLPPALRSNRDLLLLALRQEGLVLDFAAVHLRDDFEVAVAAARSNSDAIHLLPPALRHNPEIIRASFFGNRTTIYG